jgi:type II secretory pathway pseudopilin PulG
MTFGSMLKRKSMPAKLDADCGGFFSVVEENRRAKNAFTLLEVMIAAGILFMCMFAILGLLANTLRNARALQHRNVDAGMLAAELSLTNRLSEGSDSGDFGDSYPGYHWDREITEVDTNGLFQVDFSVYRSGGGSKPESHMSVLFFRPDSERRLGGGRVR